MQVSASHGCVSLPGDPGLHAYFVIEFFTLLNKIYDNSYLLIPKKDFIPVVKKYNTPPAPILASEVFNLSTIKVLVSEL
jgi:hypothetical protein